MISHPHKCIFVEVPKTGSTSVRSLLGKPIQPHLNLCEIRRGMERYWTVRRGRADRVREWVYPMLPIEWRKRRGREQFESYFKFGFVRNPWDRTVSLYERREALEMRQVMTFDAFVEWIQFSSSTCPHSSPHRYQLDWFVDADGKVLADFIGRFERLPEDWAVVAGKLGLAAALPHLRENARARHYTEYYTPRTREIIAQKFRVDIETFGYEFGN